MEKDKLKKDEEQDILLVQEVLGKEKNLIKAAHVLSEKFKQKYGPEFGGALSIDFDFVKKIFMLRCGRDYEIDLDENDVEDIPIRIKMFREQAIEDKNKPKPSIFHKKEEEKQKLKTEGGGEIKVPVKKTHDAEKELDEDDESGGSENPDEDIFNSEDENEK